MLDVSYETASGAYHQGYLDQAVLSQWLTQPDAEVYFCGPKPFMAAVESQLHFESLRSQHPPADALASGAPLGVQQLLTYGGPGYFPQRLVRRYIEEGKFWSVTYTPQVQASCLDGVPP